MSQAPAEAGPRRPRLSINGRFLVQPVTGVQRYATEVIRAAEALAAESAWPDSEIVVPPADSAAIAERTLPVTRTGRLSGHPWEQAELAFRARGDVVLSLGNTAPVLRRRQVVVIHDAGAFDTPASYSTAFRLWYRTMHHLLARSGAQIATVSRFSRQRLADRLGIAADRIEVVREGADHMNRIAPEPEILARHGLEPGRFAIAVGSRAEHKNLKSLAGAARLLREHGMVLAVAGAIDPAVFRTGADATDFPILELGRVSDGELRALYEAALCLMFPSRYEGYGLPPVEAQFCGCPVIAAGGNAVEEISGSAALVYPADDASGAERSLAHLIATEGLAQDLGARGQRLARSLTWRDAALDLAAIVERVAADGRNRPA